MIVSDCLNFTYDFDIRRGTLGCSKNFCMSRLCHSSLGNDDFGVGDVAQKQIGAGQRVNFWNETRVESPFASSLSKIEKLPKGLDHDSAWQDSGKDQMTLKLFPTTGDRHAGNLSLQTTSHFAEFISSKYFEICRFFRLQPASDVVHEVGIDSIEFVSRMGSAPGRQQRAVAVHGGRKTVGPHRGHWTSCQRPPPRIRQHTPLHDPNRVKALSLFPSL